MLNVNTHASPGSSSSSRIRSEGTSRSASVQGRRSGEIMGIEEEDEEDIEEVEEFSPVTQPNEFIEEATTPVGAEKAPPGVIERPEEEGVEKK
jgi:hypothetical protein